MGAVSLSDQSDFYQDLATTVGQTYTCSFWAYDISNPGTGFINVTFGGTQVGPASGSVASTYTQYSASIMATSTTTRFEVTGWEAAQYVISDDYNVSAPVPEPASMTALGIGVIALVRRRRNRK